MEDLVFSLNVVLPLFLLMIIGVGLRKFRILPAEFFPAANKISFSLFLPAILFLNIYDYCENFRQLKWGFPAFAGGAVVVTILLAVLIVPIFIKDKKSSSVVIQSIFRSNYLLFGIPALENMFGGEGVFSAELIIPIVIPIFNVAAVLVLSAGGSGEKKGIFSLVVSALKNPLIVATLLGLVFSFFKLQFSFELPKAIYSTTKSLASVGTPLALISLGGQFDFKSLGGNIKALTAATVLRTLIVPAVWLAVAVLLGYRTSELAALLVLLGSPAAVSSYIMAEQLDCNGQLASQIVMATTAISAFTIFIFIFLLRSLSLI